MPGGLPTGTWHYAGAHLACRLCSVLALPDRSTIHAMWFLTKLWAPWWAFGIYLVANGYQHKPRGTAGPLEVIFALWLVVNLAVTVVYVLTRVFQRASSDGRPRR